MTTEWRDLPTMADVAAAQAAGEEIEYSFSMAVWDKWNGEAWDAKAHFRSRPRKQTKTIVLREALYFNEDDGYWVIWTDSVDSENSAFLKWLDTPAREIEVQL